MDTLLSINNIRRRNTIVVEKMSSFFVRSNFFFKNYKLVTPLDFHSMFWQ